jgi:hypothetical protein
MRLTLVRHPRLEAGPSGLTFRRQSGSQARASTHPSPHSIRWRWSLRPEALELAEERSRLRYDSNRDLRPYHARATRGSGQRLSLAYPSPPVSRISVTLILPRAVLPIVQAGATSRQASTRSEGTGSRRTARSLLRFFSPHDLHIAFTYLCVTLGDVDR